MSATGVRRNDGTTTQRHADDHYRTPLWVTQAILPHLPKAVPVFDPCSGDGSILSAALSYGYSDTSGIELDAKRGITARLAGHTIMAPTDALGVEWGRPRLVIVNPPFNLAMEFVEKALAEVTQTGTVVALLRLNWLGSKKRSDFHRRHPSRVHVLDTRPSFTADGKTDSCDYAWFQWAAHITSGQWSILSRPGEKE